MAEAQPLGEDVAKVKQAIVATIETSEKQDHLREESDNLARVVPFLTEDVGSVFCDKLSSMLRSCFAPVHQQNREVAREKALTRFHGLRISDLPSLWKSLFTDLSLKSVSALLLQTVNRIMFERIMVEIFSESLEDPCPVPTLNAEEENALRYVSGYVALKLMRQYEKKDGEKATQFVECLSSMAVAGVESSFYEYTKEWIRTVDRGGLFHINDSAYHLFKAIEIETREILPRELAMPSSSRDALLERIKGSEDVQFYWSLLSIDINSPEDSDELLQAIVKLWITVLGFSVTAAWLEQYKRASHQTVNKKKALRKELQLQHVD